MMIGWLSNQLYIKVKFPSLQKSFITNILDQLLVYLAGEREESWVMQYIPDKPS